MTPRGPRLRIGELSRRTGVGADTLRAWERRYGLLRPQRSDGGFRLYSREDEERVRAMRGLIDSGISAAEAARLATEGEPQPASAAPEQAVDGSPSSLRSALERFDEAAANAILDSSLAGLTLDGVVNRLLLPAIREIGERWERGELSVAQEHFATQILRGRLLALGRNWGAGAGPLGLLACPPGERHDLGLLCFGLILREHGWRITYLGPDTPIETIERTAADLRPDAIVLAALDSDRFESVAAEIAALSAGAAVLLGGAGSDQKLAESLGARPLDPDPVQAALELAASPPSGS